MSPLPASPLASGEPPLVAPGAVGAESGPAPRSGVVRREGAGDPPPWEVVSAYLARGEHRAWVEAHAEQSQAFAEVLAALRIDHEEREAELSSEAPPFAR
jgi:hypothetical protein